jgi:hypothetical protein
MQFSIPKATAAKVAPSSLWGHTTTRFGNKFFIIGGFKDKEVLDDSLANSKIYQVTVMDDCMNM